MPQEPTEQRQLMIAPKQLAGMELCRKRKFVLFSGPRYSSKSVCGLIQTCDQAWRIPKSNIGLITISQSVGLGGGIWDQLVEEILPQYMTLGQGMEWVRKPYVAHSSKKPTCLVTSSDGSHSRIQLESLKYEEEVEGRFKSKYYTMMYVPELSNFRHRKTFDIWAESLRSMHLRDDQYLFLADTNPADDGDESWIYHVWYVHSRQTYDEYCTFQTDRGMATVPERTFLAFKESLGLLEFEIADNIFASQQRVDELRARYAHDQDLYDRYIRGLWVKASCTSVFAKQFRENIHVLGETETPGNPDPEMLIPQRDTWQLLAGLDPGQSANSAAVIFEKWERRDVAGKPLPPIFKILDEIVIVSREHTLTEFVGRILERMQFWEKYMEREYSWKHWSDRSVFDTREPLSNRYYHQLIQQASGGKITVQAAARGRGSISQRVDVLRRLLFENRILINRTFCPRLIQMLKSMPANKLDPSVPAKWTPHRHVFDALTYGVASECYDDVDLNISGLAVTARKDNETQMVSVAY